MYPGHGAPADMGLFDTTVRYIDDYTRIVRSATSQGEAMRRMTEAYPGYREADFFLKYSVMNHVRQ